MSRTIDERVVSMQFDNSNFESNVRTSLSTLDKLKQSLKLTDSGKGLDGIAKAAKNCNLNPLSSAVDIVKVKFSAMEVMAVTALANITNSAINTGKRMIKALTIDPIKTGLSEYETQINAIQTILANTKSKGSTLDDVNRALDELNTYADKTIYNFTEMTRNIGTFTAAGVDLETSVASIKGIANLAAVSGSTSQQASTAMYQLSQALAAGKVQLMDWNSVVNAGMGGEVFQTALKRTATQMGTNVDAMIKKYGSFRESLTKGEWLTTKVLTETLKQLSGAYTEAELIAQGYTQEQAKQITELAETAVSAATDVKTFTQLWDTLKESAQSGWTNTWEMIIGDFDQAKELWSGVFKEIGGIIDGSSERRNTLLEGAMMSKWDRLSKKINEAGISTEQFDESMRAALTDAGLNVDSLLDRYGSFENIFRSGKVDVDILREAIKNLNADLDGVKAGLKKGSTGEDVKKVQQALKGLGYDIGEMGVDGIIGKYTEGAIKAFQKAQGLKVTGIIDEETLAALEKASGHVNDLTKAVSGLIDGITELGGRELLLKSFANIWKGLKQIVRPIRNAFWNIFPPTTSEQLYKLIEGFEKLTAKFKLTGPQVNNIFRTFKGLFSIIDVITTIIGGGFKAAFKILSMALGALDMDILDVTASIGDAAVRFRDWLFENNRLVDGFEAVVQWVVKSGVAIKDWIASLIKIPDVGTAIANVRTAFGEAFSDIGEYFSTGWGKIMEFIDSVRNMDKISIPDILSEFKTKVVDYFTNIDLMSPLSKIGGAFSKIGGALKNFWDTVKKYAGDIGIKFGGIFESISNFITKLKETIGDKVGGMIAIGLLFGLILVIKKIADALSAIGEAIGGIGNVFKGLTNGITGFLKGLGDTLQSFQTKLKSEALLNVAKAIALLVGSIVLLTLIDQDKMWSAMLALGLLVSGLVGVSYAISKFEVADFGKISLGLMGMATAMLIMSWAAKNVGDMDGVALAKAAGAIIVFGGIVILLSKMSDKLSTLDGFGATMLKLSGGLLILSFAIRLLGGMDTRTLIQGGIAVTYFFGLMVGMISATKLIKTDLPAFGKTMLAISAALLLMSSAVRILGRMDVNSLVKGGIAVAALIGMIVGLMAATKLIDKDVGKFGTAMISIGAGLLLMSASLAILGNMDGSTIKKGLIAIAGFSGIVIALMAATKLLGRHSFNAGKFGLMLFSLGAAITMISGSILLLSLISGDRLKRAVAAVAGIGVVLAGLLAVTKFAKGIKIGTIVGLSVAIGILAIAVAALSFVDKDRLVAAAASLSIIIGMFALLVGATKFTSAKALIAIAGMTLAIVGIAFVLRELANGITNPDAALKAALGISAVVVALSAACVPLAKAGSYNIKAIGKGILIFGAILGIVSLFAGLVIWQLPNIGKQIAGFIDAIRPAIDAFNKVGKIDTGAVNGFKTLAESISLFAGAGLKYALGDLMFGGSTRAFKAFAEFINDIVQTVKQVAIDVSGENLTINTGNLNAVIGAVASLAQAASSVPKSTFAAIGSKWGGAIYSSSSQLSEFALFVRTALNVVKSVALDVSKEGVEINVGNLTSIIDAVVALAEAADSIPGQEIGAAFGKFAGGWGAGGLASFTNFTGFATFVEKALDAMSEFAGDIHEDGITKKDAETIGSICESIGLLAEAADKVPSVEIGAAFGKFAGGSGGGGYISIPALLSFTAWVSGVSDAMSGFAVDIRDAKLKDKDISNIKGICEAVGLLAEAADKAPSIEAGAAFTKFGGGGYIKIPLLGKFTEWVAEAVPVIVKMLTGTDFNVGSIRPESLSNLGSVCECIKTLAEAADKAPGVELGGAFTKFAGGWGAGGYIKVDDLLSFTAWINGIVPIMSQFALSEDVKTIDQADAAKLGTICEAVKYLGEAAEHAPGPEGAVGIASIGTMIAGGAYYKGSDLKAFSGWISEVSSAMGDFAVKTSEADITETDASNIKSLCEAVKYLGEAAGEAPPSYEVGAGLAVIGPMIAGGGYFKATDLKAFSEWVAEVSKEMGNFAIDVQDASIDEGTATKIKSLCEAVKILAEAADMAPGTELAAGFAVTVAGLGGAMGIKSTDLTAFKDWIVDVADAMKTFATDIGSADSITTESLAKVTTICEAVKILAEGAKMIPTKTEYDGWFNDWIESAQFTEVVTWMTDALTAVSEVATKIAGVDSAQIDNTKLMTLATSVKTIADACYAFASTFNIQMFDTDTFSYTIERIGDAIVGFYQVVNEAGVDAGAASAAASAANSLSSVISTLAGFDYSTLDCDAFQTAITDIATAMQQFETDIEGVDVSGAVTQINALTTALTNISNGSFGGTGNLATALSDLANSGIDKFVSAFSGAGDKVASAGKSMVDGLVSAIDTRLKLVGKTVTTAVDSAATSIRNGYISFYSAGSFLSDGLAAGISSKVESIKTAAVNVVTSAIAAAKAAAGIASPSKETRKLGVFFGEGFALGITDRSREIYKEGAAMADSAKRGLASAISKVRDIIDSDIDTQPTIRPVLDLSEIEAGANGISSMFGVNPSVRALSRVGRINTMMNGRQNGTNDDVISAIKDLGRKIGNVSGDTYNVNGVTYDDGSNITDAVKTLVRAARVERRI